MVKASLLGRWALGWVNAGRYVEAESNLEKALILAQKLEVTNVSHYLWDLGLVAGMQGKHAQSERYFSEAVKTIQSMRDLDIPMSNSLMSKVYAFMGAAAFKQSNVKISEKYLDDAIDLKETLQDNFELVMVLVWRGQVEEAKNANFEAEYFYRKSLELQWTGRLYFVCTAFTGLVRVKHAQGDYAAISPLLTEAEQLAQQYEYNDHLASLRLTQGHIAWEGNAPTWDNGFEAAMHFYQHALIYALRYNRFLLDEVLSGRPQGTPLRPIIPHCLERGAEGRQMLIALRDWWQTGVNDIGTPRPDTISPIPEGSPLLEAERIAREREPGDGSMQKSVIEQIEAVSIW